MAVIDSELINENKNTPYNVDPNSKRNITKVG